MSARLLDCTTAEYHKDPCERPSLSASIAKEIVTRSPLHAWQSHPRLGGKPREASKDMDTGSLLHALLLDQPLTEFAILPFSSFQTKAAREARDEAEAAGKIVVRAADFEEAQTSSAIIRERIADHGIVLDGASELKVEWTEATPEGEVLCRGMMDHVTSKPGFDMRIVDLKSTRSGDLKSISRHILEYGYDLQQAAYRSALGKLHPETRNVVDFVFLFFEVVPPYAVTPVRLDGQFRNFGEIRWEMACRTWARCLRSGHWPGYVESITSVEAPAWAMAEVQF